MTVAVLANTGVDIARNIDAISADETPAVSPLSDQDVLRAVDDVCVTASRAGVDQASVARAIETLFTLRGGAATKISTLVEMAQRRGLSAGSILPFVHQEFPVIHEHQTAMKARLDVLNADTAARNGKY